jgi:hypothetical protein
MKGKPRRRPNEGLKGRTPARFYVPVTGVFVHDWTKQAECTKPGVDLSVFFAEKAGSEEANGGARGGPGMAEARAICARCPVTDLCLEGALEAEGTTNHRFGMFGGMSPLERVRIVRSRQRAKAKKNRVKVSA